MIGFGGTATAADAALRQLQRLGGLPSLFFGVPDNDVCAAPFGSVVLGLRFLRARVDLHIQELPTACEICMPRWRWKEERPLILWPKRSATARLR